MSLRSIQAEGHRLIDAHYQALTNQIRLMFEQSSLDPRQPLEREALKRRIEILVMQAEPKLASALADLFTRAEQDGERNG